MPRPPRSASTKPDDVRSEVRVFGLEDLLDHVLAGRLRSTEFTYPSRWTARDAEHLLDSMSRGYPTGSLLLWQRPAAADVLRIGSVTLAAPPRFLAWQVVDGQQRLAALTRVFAGAGHGVESFALHFDLETETFTRLPRKTAPSPHHLPLTEVLDAERLRRWIRQSGRPRDEQPAFRLRERLLAYSFPAWIIHTNEENAVWEIYARVHQAGHPVTPNKLHHIGQAARSGPRVRGPRATAKAMGFGILEDTLVERLVRAVHVPLQAPADTDARLERAASHLLAFLVQDAQISHRSLVPEDALLSILTAFFDRFPQPHPRSRELLTRWLWRASIRTATAPGSLDVRPGLAALHDADEARAVQALLATVPRSPAILPTRRFDADSAVGRLQLLAMQDRGPLHLVHAGPLPITSARAMSRPLLPRAPEEWRPHLANYIVHPALPGGLRAALLKVEDPAVLASHAITPDAHQLLRRRDLPGFLAARAETLETHMNAFLARHTRWEQSDRPPLAALTIGDED